MITRKIKQESNTMQTKGCLITIFGATGDLTHRKLIPALYQLHFQGFIPENFHILAIGRKNLTAKGYLEQLQKSVEKYTSSRFSEEYWDFLKARIEYVRLDFTDQGSYERLAEIIREGRN